jgi:hypothetical protein
MDADAAVEQQALEQRDGGEAPPRRRRRRRWPWVVLILLIGLVAGLRALLPFAVERGTAWGSRYYLGLPARIDNVDFALLEGVVVLEGVTLAAQPDGVAPNDAALQPPPLDTATALLHVGRIQTRLDWKSLRDRTVHLTELAIEAPAVRVTPEADGKIDPLRHAQPLAPKSTEPEAAPEPPAADAPPPWKVALDRFDLRAPNVLVLDPKGGEDLLAFSLEEFGLTDVSAQGTEFALGGVSIGGPVLRVRRDLVLAEKPAATADPAAGSAAVADTAAAPAPDAAATAAAPPAAAPRAKPGYRVAKVDIQRATFTWVTDQGPLEVTLALQASDINADEGKRFPLDLKLQIGDGDIHVAGDVGILPPSYTGKFEWNGLPIPRLLLASVPQFATWLRAAKSSGDLQLDADPMGAKGPAATRVSGRLSFDALAVADPKNNEITLGWQQLEVVMRDVYAPIPQAGKPLATTVAVLDSVKLVRPEIRYTRPSPQLDALLGINLSGGATVGGKPAAKPEKVEKPAAKAVAVSKKAEAGAAPAAPLDLQIAKLQMTNGSVEALDKTVKPITRTKIGGLALDASDVRFPATAAKGIHLQATLPKTAKLDVRGDLKPGNVGDFTLKLKQLELPVFNPYSSAAAGVTIDQGTASIETKLKMRGVKMEIDNHLVLNKLGVSMREPETFERSFGVPIDLALALLRDPQGNIALHIPVKMDEKGATIAMGAVIASALKAALVGAITAPLKMIGAVFSGDGGSAGGMSIDPLPSLAGSPELDGDQTGRLDGLAQMLSERPAMGLALRGRVGPEDRPIVAQQILVERWASGAGLPELDDASFLARRRVGQALSKRAKGEAAELAPEDQALFDRYVAAVPVPDERLAALAKSRAERVRQLLVEKGVAAGRVAVGDAEAESKPGVVIGFKAS